MAENRRVDRNEDVYGEPVTYPYQATEERVLQIKSGIEKISEGMSELDVRQSLGKPNEIHETLDKNNWDRNVGCSFVYLVRRDRERGSVNEKNEKLVRVHFDVTGIVNRIDFVGEWEGAAQRHR